MDNVILANLWNALTVTVDRFHASVKVHAASVFLGYADLTIDAVDVSGLRFKVRGVGVKLLKGSPYLDFPSERGQDGVYYPLVFPLTGELRKVLTVATFQSTEVRAVVSEVTETMELASEVDSSGTAKDMVSALSPYTTQAKERTTASIKRATSTPKRKRASRSKKKS